MGWKRFLRFLYKRVYGYYPFMYPTKYLQGTLGFNSLETRRLSEQMVIICRIIRGLLNCPDLLAEVSRLCVPEHRARFRPGRVPLFAPRSARTVARQQSPVCRAQRHLNATILNTHNRYRVGAINTSRWISAHLKREFIFDLVRFKQSQCKHVSQCRNVYLKVAKIIPEKTI